MNRRSSFPLFSLTVLLSVILQMVALPDAIAAFRPEWVALTLVYWAYSTADKPVLLVAWISGLALDVLFNSLLGQHALALVTISFLVRRLRGTLILFPMLQVALALALAWALYAFLMFWIDGLSHHSAVPSLRWLPVISTTLVFPLAALLMDRLRAQPKLRRLT
ncbi:MAG: mreD [Nevskia sp.]|nr:mreD [Nevskia sp.]